MGQLQEDILTLERIASFRVVQPDDDSQALFRVAARLTALAALSEDELACLLTMCEFTRRANDSFGGDLAVQASAMRKLALILSTEGV